MRKIILMAAVAIIAATSFSSCSKSDDDGGDGGGYNGHNYVDLGLPSGVKWAICNIGATTPEGYGDYYAWGETETKTYYDWGTYKWMTSGQSSWKYVNKYQCADNETSACWYNGSTFIGDGKTTLELSDDVAHVKWGGSWRMPTMTEFKELEENCTWTWTTQNGVNGYKVTSNKNGNSIFLPAAGYRINSLLDDAGSGGHYWSSTLYGNGSFTAKGLYFISSYRETGNHGRTPGRSVRAVCP